MADAITDAVIEELVAEGRRGRHSYNSEQNDALDTEARAFYHKVIGRYQAAMEAARQPQLPSDDGLIKALEPFAAFERGLSLLDEDSWKVFHSPHDQNLILTIGDFRRAAEALSRHKAPLSEEIDQTGYVYEPEDGEQSVAGDDVERMRATLHKSRSWLFECWGWLLETDLDMKCPMETDPLDIVEEIDALLGIDAALTALQVTEGDKS